MEPTFTDAFETPVLVKVDDVEYTLQRLKARDYLDWIAEIQKNFQEKNLPLIAKMELSPTEKVARESQILFREFTPDDCKPKIGLMDGACRVVRKAFVRNITKKMLTDDKNSETMAALTIAEKFIEDQPWPDLLAVAIRVSGLFHEQEFMEWFHPEPKRQEQTDPNAVSRPLRAAV